MDLVEVVQDEVKEGGAGRGRTVVLPGFVDLDFRRLRFLHFHFNLSRYTSIKLMKKFCYRRLHQEAFFKLKLLLLPKGLLSLPTSESQVVCFIPHGALASTTKEQSIINTIIQD